MDGSSPKTILYDLENFIAGRFVLAKYCFKQFVPRRSNKINQLNKFGMLQIHHQKLDITETESLDCLVTVSI
jgi:hypothetical protein